LGDKIKNYQNLLKKPIFRQLADGYFLLLTTHYKLLLVLVQISRLFFVTSVKEEFEPFSS
jgi:hypothetical protein